VRVKKVRVVTSITPTLLPHVCGNAAGIEGGGGWSVASGVAHDYIDPLAASDARGAHFFGWLMPSVVLPGE